jgi:hypothetical protein
MALFNKIILIILIIFGIFILINKIFKNIEYHIDLPEGSWKDSCTVLSFRHPILWAECLDDYAKPKQTSINTDNCIEVKLGKNELHKRKDGSNLDHRHLNKSVIYHIHKLRNVNGMLECE